MRVQLSPPLRAALILFSLALLSQDARADGRAAGFVSVYMDDDELTVVSPQASATQDIVADVSADVAYDADIISAATVDVRTAASPRGYEEVRHGLQAGLLWQPRATTNLGMRWIGSWEPDFVSHGIGASTSRAWLDDHLTTSVSVLARFNRAGRATEARNRWLSRFTSVAGASLGLVLDRWTVATLAYELQMSNGFMGSPYRFVRVAWPSGTQVLVPEAHPTERVRHGARLGARRALSYRWFLAGGYRIYGDSWGVSSHTGDVELQAAFTRDRLIVAAGFRAYYQTAASFYESGPQRSASEGTVPTVRTADKLLSKSWSLLPGVRLEMNLRSLGSLTALRAALKAELYEQRFVDFTPLDRRRAAIVSLGISAAY